MGYELNPFTKKLDKVGAGGGGGTTNITGVITVTPGGNTAGVTNAISSGSVMLAGGNNITLSQNGSTISFVGPNTVAQTQFVLSNSNGVSFGTNGSTVTATVRTDYQSAGAYLTTARASNDAIGLNTAFTNVTATANSSGLSINAAGYAGTGTTGTNATFTLNSNGLQLNAGAYLTTAMASNRGTDFVQANAAFAGTNASGTIASNGISISVAAPGAGGGGALKGSGTYTQNTGTIEFANSNGITFGLSNNGTMTASHNGITQQSTQPVAASASNGSFNFSTLKFVEGSGVTWATQANGIQASVKTDYQSSNANYLTSQSNQALSGSNGSFTFQTATFGSSNGMHFYTTNGSLVGSYTVPTQSVQPVAASASNGSFNFSTLNFSNANNVTFGTSAGGIVTASVAAPGAAAENNWFNLIGANTAGNTTASGSTIGLSGINLTLSGTNGSQIIISAGAGGGGGGSTFSNWEPYQDGNNSTYSSMGQNSLYIQKLKPEHNYSFANFELRMSGSIVSSSNSQVAAHSIRYGLYSMDTNSSYNSIATSLLAMTASYNSTNNIGFTVSQGAASFTATSNASGMASYYTGLKHLYLPFAGSMSAGGSYAFAYHISSATTVNTGAMRMAILQHTNINNLTIGKIYGSTVSASNASFVGDFAQGVLTATTGAMPAAVAKSQMSNQVSQARVYMQLDS